MIYKKEGKETGLRILEESIEENVLFFIPSTQPQQDSVPSFYFFSLLPLSLKIPSLSVEIP